MEITSSPEFKNQPFSSPPVVRENVATTAGQMTIPTNARPIRKSRIEQLLLGRKSNSQAAGRGSKTLFHRKIPSILE
jgi:hypothetical protein